MKSLADRIEEYVRVLIDRSENKTLEVQRTELAETFNCAPSQITYVLATRFTREQGFIIESRRGGKGYIKIRREETLPNLQEGGCSEEEAFRILEMLVRKQLLSPREADLFKRLISNNVIGEAGGAKALRARMLEVLIGLLGNEA